MTTHQKGQIAQLKTEQRAIEKGWIVSRPSSTDCRYDLVLDNGSKLFRTQVKYCNGRSSHSAGAIRIELRKPHKNHSLRYTDEIDLIICYLPILDKLVLLRSEHFHGRPQFTMRYEAPKNGQTDGLNLVNNFIW